MITADDMREAASKGEVYRLLTGYVEALRKADELSCHPQPMTQLPFDGTADVRERVARLIGEIDVASRRWDHHACRAIKQALYVFATALNRLEALERDQPAPAHANEGNAGRDALWDDRR
jgi:hypothetical protein